jgi:hypothetical protein
VSPAPTAHGPYEQEPREPFIAADQRKTLLAQALQGVELGSWDRRILDWLATHPDTSTFLTILGILQRATATTAQPATAQVQVIDPGAPHLVLLWQAHDGHGHQASGQLAGAPPTPEAAGWRYQTFTEAAQAAVDALQDLEGLSKATVPEPTPHDPATAGAPARRPVCDFCAEQPAAWRYPTRRDGLIPVGGVALVLPAGDWLACPACHQLVEAGLWLALSIRARLSAEHGAVLWAYFRETRGGPAIPLDPQGGEVQ